MRRLLTAVILVLLIIMPGLCLANTEVTTKTITRGDSLRIEYPVVNNLEDKKIQKTINQDIVKQIRDFIKSVRANGADNSITGKYTVTYDKMDTLSIKMDLSVMPENGAYPTNYVKGLNYNMETGDILQYGFMQIVSVEDVNKALTKHLKEKGIELPGFKSVESVPSEFYIDEQGELVSIIPEGIVGPHAIGVLQFKIF